MKVLVACECSQVVTSSFRLAGCEAFSCDLQKSYGTLPEYHIQADAISVLYSQSWDLVIAHPPCTYLSNAYTGLWDNERIEKQHQAAEFFMKFYNYTACPICIENPKMRNPELVPPASQFIQPYFFGEPFSKYTLLWLRGLPCLYPTDIVKSERSWVSVHSSSRVRSKTFNGIATAMAFQWSPDIISAYSLFGGFK